MVVTGFLCCVDIRNVTFIRHYDCCWAFWICPKFVQCLCDFKFIRWDFVKLNMVIFSCASATDGLSHVCEISRDFARSSEIPSNVAWFFEDKHLIMLPKLHYWNSMSDLSGTTLGAENAMISVGSTLVLNRMDPDPSRSSGLGQKEHKSVHRNGNTCCLWSFQFIYKTLYCLWIFQYGHRANFSEIFYIKHWLERSPLYSLHPMSKRAQVCQNPERKRIALDTSNYAQG